MCNTGIYFMDIHAARTLAKTAMEYLDRASTISPNILSSFVIDSLILWSAQQILGYDVKIFSSSLNYLVPAEDFYEVFLRSEYPLADIETNVPVALFHFSRGSDLKFLSFDTEACRVVLRTNSKKIFNTRSYFKNIVAEEKGKTVCFIFSMMLESFTDHVTLTDDNATAYFR